MLIFLAAALAVIAAVLVIRYLWRARQSADYGTVLAVLAAALVIGLVVLAATGRLHWIAAVAAAFLPFLRRLVGVIRYLPLLRRLFSEYQGRNGGAGPRRPTPSGPMTRDRAIEILGLGPHPTREEVIAAHRRLMQHLHPDRGGSTFLAQQLNEARKTLLDQ